MRNLLKIYKKNSILAMLLLLSLGIQAQKVKIKKGLISVDNTEAALVKKRENKTTKEKSFVFYDIQQQDSVVFRAYALQAQDYYFGIHASFVSDTADMKMESVAFTFNEEKAVTELLVKKHKFITSGGLQKETVKNYITNQDERLIPQALAQVEKVKAMASIVASMDLKVTKNWNITSRDFVVGKIKDPTALAAFGRGSNPSFLDKENNEFARITDASNVSSKTTIMTPRKSFEVETNTPYTAIESRQEYLTEIVKSIASNGYLPSNMLLAPLAIINQGELVFGELKVKDHQSLFGFFSTSFLQDKNKSANQGDDYVIAYTSESRVDSDDDLSKIFFGGYKKINASECDMFSVTNTYDEQGKPSRAEEFYAPVTFTKKYNDPNTKSTNPGGVKMGKLLAPRNYTAIYKYDDMYILSIEWGNKGTMARDYFVKEDLLEFAKDYPAMIQKIESDNNYLNGEEGLKQFAEDMDDVIIANLKSN